MARPEMNEYETVDEFEFSYGPDFDQELFDETSIDDLRPDDRNLAAWQRIEMRQESDWLRSQVVDWDDWDEYFDAH